MEEEKKKPEENVQEKMTFTESELFPEDKSKETPEEGIEPRSRGDVKSNPRPESGVKEPHPLNPPPQNAERFGEGEDSGESVHPARGAYGDTPTDVPHSGHSSPSQSYQSYMEGWKKENPIESEEDYQKRRKRMQNAALLGAVSDGISAISNLYYTTQYAPSAKNPNLSGKMLYRYNQMEKERNANKKAWAEGAMRARQLDDAKDKDDRNWRRQLERDAKQDEKDANAERRAQEKHDWEKDLQDPKKRLAEAQAGTAELRLKNLPQEQADKHAQSQASTAAANRSHRSSGQGDGKEKKYPVYHKDGTTTYASSEEEWESQIVAETEPQERNRVYMRDGKGNIYADKKTLTRLNGRHLQIGKKRMRSRSYK